jgi:alpha-ketoglutaric semialdehyde dehydrogenase
MTLTGESFVGTARVAGTGVAFQGYNPAAAAPLPTVFRSVDAAVVDRAARLAAEAAPAFARLTAKQRGEFLRALAAGLEAATAELAAQANLETGLPLPRLQGEIGRTCGQLRFYAAAVEEGTCLDARIDHADPNRKPLPKPDVRSVLRPLGPVAVFGSSNFPFAYSVAGGDTASALAAGCPVIVKAHPAHPGTSELVAAVIVAAAQQTGMPAGVFSMLFDAGHTVGAALVQHPAIQAVGFTGSLRGGRALMDLAAARPQPIPVYAEMGSVNPVFILPGALAARGADLAAGLHASVTLGVGQFCTNPGLHILPAGSAAQAFLARLGELMAGTPAGAMLTSGICDNYRKGAQRLAGSAGVTTVAQAAAGGAHGGAAQVFVTDAPRFLADHTLAEEVFGPATLAITYGSDAELLAVARALDGQLTVSVHGTEADFAQHAELLAVLAEKAGRVVFNGFPTGVEVCHAMVHGGPYPAASDSRSTSVGTRAALRFLRPVCYQGAPDAQLPGELKEANPLGLLRLVDGSLQR